jgi:hypothetical protein
MKASANMSQRGKMRFKLSVILPLLSTLLCFSAFSYAQLWSGVLDSNRAVDWSQAGAGTLPSRTTVCATFSPGASAAQINSAIAACPANQVVFLNAGTYNLSAGITFNGKNNVTLRGAGPDKTFLVFTGHDACGGLNANICVVNSSPNYAGNPVNMANWTAGYGRGTTVITLDNVAKVQPGTLLILDQVNDSADTGNVWICGTNGLNVCCIECASGVGRNSGSTYRQQTQIVKVVAVSGNNVTIETGLMMPQWRSSQSPGAWWSSSPAVVGVGVEDVSLDISGDSGSSSGIAFYLAYASWAKNVRVSLAGRNNVWIYESSHITVKDSYFYGGQNYGSQSYGIERGWISSHVLIENNIFHHMTAPEMSNNDQGSVIAYNYAVNDYDPQTGWLSSSEWHHGPGIDFTLYEGNVTPGFRADYFHGLSHFTTGFRNWWQGWSPNTNAVQIPVHIQMGHRYFNMVGNVLGKTGVHNQYQSLSNGSTTNCDQSIFALGWGAVCDNTKLAPDPMVYTTLLRWGNYDTVNNAARFAASEVPSALSLFANALPTSQTLPASFYRASKPGWWPANIPWPAIGPDVTGGAGPGGHAYLIPAQNCYTSVMGGSTDGTETSPLTFNANNCYAGSGSTPAPNPPTNVRAVVR